ncbi:MAG: DoxX family protein [Actinomycetota bacterium]|nr:DoxX family protein [Actinomycetota bacterium]
MSDAAGVLVLIGRVLFGGIFAYSGWSAHIKMSSGMEGYAKQMNFPLPAIAGWPTGLWLILGGLSLILGIWADLGALMIIAFLLLAAAYFHRFWELPDADPQKMMQTGFFFRNVIGIAACLVFFGVFATLGDGLPYALTGSLFDL